MVVLPVALTAIGSACSTATKRLSTASPLSVCQQNQARLVGADATLLVASGVTAQAAAHELTAAHLSPLPWSTLPPRESVAACTTHTCRFEGETVLATTSGRFRAHELDGAPSATATRAGALSTPSRRPPPPVLPGRGCARSCRSLASWPLSITRTSSARRVALWEAVEVLVWRLLRTVAIGAFAVGCASAGSQSVSVTPGNTTSGLRPVSSTTVGAGAPTSMVTSSTAGGGGSTVVVGLTDGDSGRAVQLRVGESLRLALDGAGTQWGQVSVDPEGLLQGDPTPSPPPHGALLIWTAARTGTVTISSTATAWCPSGVACPMWALLFKVTVVIG